ncbi:BtrH N-terminal domain-containing protein [Paenibacillus polysaccharolyticus]|uniref:BtrH N-terminal domain-containing protein n=1 Tax=Paenibacillus polysaccharolyticus TaxID=582692 RepID=UPI0029598210|nr:hypothetical protein [Paenibacillus intestini]
MTKNHCYYYIIARLAKEKGIDLNEIDIFYLLGGYGLKIEEMNNGYFPHISVTGNKVNNEIFEDRTGIKFFHLNYTTEKFEVANLIEALKVRNYVSAVANCYFLTYDHLNYKNNIGSHFIFIHQYDISNDTFLVSDNKFECVSIKRNDLDIALKNVPNSNNEVSFFDIEVVVEDVGIKDRIPEIIKLNALELLKNCKKELLNLKKGLEKLKTLEPIYKSLSYTETLNSIKSLNGPIVSRKYLLQSFTDDEIRREINKLIGMWEKLCISLYKIYEIGTDINLDGQLEDILELELLINEKILNNVK